MICEYCHQEFTPQGAYRRKYCSPQHKNLAGARLRAARNAEQSERRCYRCHEVKPAGDFPGRTHSYCRTCYNAYQRERSAALPLEQRRAPARRHRERQRADPVAVAAINAGRRRYKFALTDEQFAALLAQQGGGCAICRASEPGGRGTWHVDHDHTCCPPYSKGGKAKTCGRCVRGLLCSRCNVGLGNFRHDPQFLIAAVQYLAGSQAANEIART